MAIRHRHGPRLLPEHLRHQRAGDPEVGIGRSARGLLLRGVVLAVYKPDDPTNAARSQTWPFDPTAHNSILCDVLIIDRLYRTKLTNVPIVMASAGLNDHEVWVPRPTSLSLQGEALALSLEGSQIPTSATHNMDGDHVLIGFLGDDTHQPVILGQIVHPRTKRRPSSSDPTQFKWRRFVRGIAIGITNQGNLEIDFSSASDGSILAGPGPTAGDEVAKTGADPLGGNTTITIPPGASFSLIDSAVSAPARALLGDNYLQSLQTYQAAESAFLAAEGVYLASEQAYLTAESVYLIAEGVLTAAQITYLAAEDTYQSAHDTFAQGLAAATTIPEINTIASALSSAIGTYRDAVQTFNAATVVFQAAGIVFSVAVGTRQAAVGAYQAALTTFQAAQSTFAGEVSTSLAGGLPFLSVHVKLD